MKNREEIVSAFKQCGLPGACLKCKYGAEKEGCYAALKHDVLELLKEQEPKPVELHTNAYGTKFYFCPKCKRELFRTLNLNFCEKCGQAVQWDET